MSDAGVVLGFALVFVVTAWATSAGLALGVTALGRRLRALGPAAERRAAALAIALPVVVAGGVVATLLVRAVTGADHCEAHDHHAHLCLVHGQAWAHRPWVVALVAVAATDTVARLVLLVGALVRGRRALRPLRATSAVVDGVHLVDSPRPFGFVAGLWRPRIYVSTAAWSGLADDERAAMLAHERGHVAHGDVAWRAALEAVAAFGAPLTPAPLLARWDHATERVRDRDAAEEIGDAGAVASAMVRLCRLGAGQQDARAIGFPAAAGALDDRVDALLADAPRGDRAATALARWWLVALAATALALATQAEPLHHVLESLLG